MVLVYLPTKLGHFWGYSSTMEHLGDGIQHHHHNHLQLGDVFWCCRCKKKSVLFTTSTLW